MAIIDLRKVEYVSMYTGNNGSDACTCKCPCCSQSGIGRRYQGTMNQVMQMFDILPNLKQLYLFGNPDITVDTDFCSRTANEAVKRGIHVCFSTSGVGGKEVLKRLLKGISPTMVDYISFSFDATTEQEMSFLKGIKYPMKEALEGLEWAMENGYKVKVQPTLWSCNYTKAGEIINFFADKGVEWFTFHIGSVETKANVPTHKHLTVEQVENVHNQISEAVCNHNEIKVRCPTIYKECGSNDSQKWYCMHPERIKELLIMLTGNGIIATHTPMASGFKKDLAFILSQKKAPEVITIPNYEYCPFSDKMSGRDDTYCRYVSKYWNY